MRKLLASGAVAGLILLGGGVLPASAAPAAGQICPDFDGKIDVKGNVESIPLTAPDGMVITAVCVKSGSANQGSGAEITYYNPGSSPSPFGAPTARTFHTTRCSTGRVATATPLTD
ncbi:hypothetical protein ACW0JT_04725 [Arthrobacter sp. SA17]